jgi:hypothetical protein
VRGISNSAVSERFVYGTERKFAELMSRKLGKVSLTVLFIGSEHERVLSSTNLIENLFSWVREIGCRVRHWQSGTMVLRWSAADVLEAKRSFRKIAGYRAMPILVAALRAHDAKLGRASNIDDREKAA